MSSDLRRAFARRRAAFVAALTLVVVLAGTTLAAAPGDPLKLGMTNTINAATTWTGAATSRLLSISNTSTAAGARALSVISKAAASTLYVQNTGTGPGIQISVAAGKAPISVNGTAGKATNLNADRVDGLDESAFLRGNVLNVSYGIPLSTGSAEITWFATPIVQPAGHVLLSDVAGEVTATFTATCGGSNEAYAYVYIDGWTAALAQVAGGTGGEKTALFRPTTIARPIPAPDAAA